MGISMDLLAPSLPMFVHQFQCLSVEYHVRDSLSWSRFWASMTFFLTGQYSRSPFLLCRRLRCFLFPSSMHKGPTTRICLTHR
jgi:hypothetical protein